MQRVAVLSVVIVLMGVFVVNGNPTLTRPSNDIAVPQLRKSPNMFQQALINQLLNQFVPLDVQAEIKDVAAIFGFQRNDFLFECLQQLQKLEKYAKYNLVSLIKKAIKFAEEKLSREQQKQLEQLEQSGIELGKIIFSGRIKEEELNQLYDLVMKAVRDQIDGQGFTDQLPKLINGILQQHMLDDIIIG
ncbi:unnamed protein product [Didymodactylos carnosus]|uniref:Uncharacterized protein n=1 Tax=Didymodactylos carnosus TaxID=1234261 RepID=A0A815F3U3_9BILA|nr:unnamed protein product [Didymodactylos carnosus]CAF1318456.1 unnamed protein product [Didymodactylos carnosus]CAF4069884.1 unnamed protein product [Didymodactylos carnosus]CAF4162206.1 unnamed protein product [Didymodactylos carnosus]